MTSVTFTAGCWGVSCDRNVHILVVQVMVGLKTRKEASIGVIR